MDSSNAFARRGFDFDTLGLKPLDGLRELGIVTLNFQSHFTGGFGNPCAANIGYHVPKAATFVCYGARLN